MERAKLTALADVAELPVAEKLILMEKLWDALRAHADGVILDWHKEILADRLRRLGSGREPVSPWTEAKERIRVAIKAG